MRTPEQLLRSIIGVFARENAVPGHGQPLWSIISQFTGHGSTVSCEICTLYGFDPHVMVRIPVFIDESTQFIGHQCSKCGQALAPEEPCEECDLDA